jgi:hypothetical protein
LSVRYRMLPASSIGNRHSLEAVNQITEKSNESVLGDAEEYRVQHNPNRVQPALRARRLLDAYRVKDVAAPGP